jgi:hypothetical protein
VRQRGKAAGVKQGLNPRIQVSLVSSTNESYAKPHRSVWEEMSQNWVLTFANWEEDSVIEKKAHTSGNGARS